MADYFTSGQIARQLRISISTLKRWLEEAPDNIPEIRNSNGWRLFSAGDLEVLREFKRDLHKKGKRFNDTTLLPVNIDIKDDHTIG
ncbi:MAG TPA: MerR family transcriptional regulator [Chitinispirillaceae bacterium]|nr:MerR family transcriptional regulator [Chitinispirillaceae bacterium]